MLHLTLDKKYHIPDEWTEISFGQILEITDLVEKECPEVYRRILYGEIEEDETPEINPEDAAKYVEFQIKYLSIVTGIEDIIIRNLRPKNGVDIVWMFERLSKFLGFPVDEDLECKEFIEVEGKKYYREPSAVDSFGRVTNLQNADYATYATGMVVNSIIQNIRNGKVKTHEITMLTATMFRPRVVLRRNWLGRNVYGIEPYNANAIEERTLLFKKASASDVFGAYFFLLREQRKSIKNFKLYFSERLRKAKTSKWLAVRLTMVWLKWYLIGFWLGIQSRRREFSRMIINRLFNA